MNRRRLIGTVAAVVLAAVGTFVIVAYVKGAERRALAGEQTVEVLVVSDRVSKGTPAEELAGLIRTERIPAKVQAAGGVDDLAVLHGKVAAVDLLPGEQLVGARFIEPSALAQLGDVTLPEGHQLVTISLSPDRAVGGQVRPGDTVGVIASFGDGAPGAEGAGEASQFLLNDVLVMNVQGAAAPVVEEKTAEEGKEESRPPAPGGNFFITLAVDTPTAERIVFAAEYGTLWLTSQPGNTDVGGSQLRTKGSIY